jgi:hypothetical protein
MSTHQNNRRVTFIHNSDSLMQPGVKVHRLQVKRALWLAHCARLKVFTTAQKGNQGAELGCRTIQGLE